MTALITTTVVTVAGAIASFVAFFQARRAVNARREQVAHESEEAQREFEQLREAELTAAWEKGAEAARKERAGESTAYKITPSGEIIHLTKKPQIIRLWEKQNRRRKSSREKHKETME